MDVVTGNMTGHRGLALHSGEDGGLRRSRVTIRDVARRAGVSHQTVSRVINGSPDVLPETRQRVEAAVTELGYHPNEVARSLAEGRTRTLACISPNLIDYTFASVIEGAENEARAKGYFLLSASAPDEMVFDELIRSLVGSRRIDGLLVMNPYIDNRAVFIPENFPVVVLGAVARNLGMGWVALDDTGAGWVATQHLLRLGHRHLACITGPLNEDCSQERLKGYQLALQAEGLMLDPTLIGEGDWQASSAYRQVSEWLQQERPFSAVFAHNDRMAIGTIRALHQAGLRVPDDVSVIGVDDLPLASYFDPPLTTVRQDMTEIGRAAAQALIEAVENPLAVKRQVRLPVELVVRASTAPCVHREEVV